MRNIAVIDDGFDINQISSYQLLIQYCERSFSFMIQDIRTTKFIAYKNYWFEEPIPRSELADQLRNLLNTENYLTQPFHSVRFLYIAPISVLVPSALFKKEDPGIYFNHSTSLSATDTIIFRKISSLDSYLLFPIPADLADQITFMLKDAQLICQGQPMIEEVIGVSRDKESNHVYANINPGIADLLIVQSGQLTLYNSFVINSAEDFVFFLLYLYDQFSLSQEECPISLSGYIELYPGALDLLPQYIKQITLSCFPKRYFYSDSFKDLTQHHFTQLINLARCE
jgi:hypothetical protein